MATRTRVTTAAPPPSEVVSDWTIDTAYRVVQEAVTNAIRHAGPAPIATKQAAPIPPNAVNARPFAYCEEGADKKKLRRKNDRKGRRRSKEAGGRRAGACGEFPLGFGG